MVIVMNFKLAKNVYLKLNNMTINLPLFIEIQIERHWISETVNFCISGEAKEILKFAKIISEAVKKYNL